MLMTVSIANQFLHPKCLAHDRLRVKRNLLVFQIEVSFTLPIDTHQFPVVNGIDVFRFLRIAMDSYDLAVEKGMVSANKFTHYLALIGCGYSLDDRRFEIGGGYCFKSGGGEFVHGASRFYAAQPGGFSLFLRWQA